MEEFPTPMKFADLEPIPCPAVDIPPPWMFLWLIFGRELDELVISVDCMTHFAEPLLCPALTGDTPKLVCGML